jgi:hypothetical protein
VRKISSRQAAAETGSTGALGLRSFKTDLSSVRISRREEA